MKITKRDKTIENLELDKIKTSIENSAYDINFILTLSDINIIIKDIKIILESLHCFDGTTSTYEVRGIIYHTLINNGFSEIASSYMKTK